jgi:predicted transcriptional regulator
MNDIVFNENIPVIVGEAVAGETAKIRKQLEKVINSVNTSAFDIASLALSVKQSGDYAGHTTFQDYAKTLKIKTRKIQYLVKMAETMQAVGIPREEYEPLGIAKLREITSLDPNGKWLNPENNQELPLKDFIVGFVKQSSDMDLDTIKSHVKVLKGLTGENDIEILHFAFTKSVIDNILEPAFEKAKMVIGSVAKDSEGISQDASKSKCIEVMATEFLSNEYDA